MASWFFADIFIDWIVETLWRAWSWKCLPFESEFKTSHRTRAWKGFINHKKVSEAQRNSLARKFVRSIFFDISPATYPRSPQGSSTWINCFYRCLMNKSKVPGGRSKKRSERRDSREFWGVAPTRFSIFLLFSFILCHSIRPIPTYVRLTIFRSLSSLHPSPSPSFFAPTFFLHFPHLFHPISSSACTKSLVCLLSALLLSYNPWARNDELLWVYAGNSRNPLRAPHAVPPRYIFQNTSEKRREGETTRKKRILIDVSFPEHFFHSFGLCLKVKASLFFATEKKFGISKIFQKKKKNKQTKTSENFSKIFTIDTKFWLDRNK